MPRPIVYGIPNCEQIKKTLAWFAAKRIDVEFHDYKKAGIERARLESWTGKIDWETLLNRKGTTWRKLAPAEQAKITSARAAITLMLGTPSVIKRPVVAVGARLHVGYDPAAFETLLK